MTEIAGKVGRRIATLRKRARLTQRQLADAIGTSPEVVSRLEHGAVTPSLERVEEIARALRVHPRDLFDFTDGRGAGAERLERLSTALQRVSEDDAALLVAMAEFMAARRREK